MLILRKSKKKTAEEYPVPELNYQYLESFVILETQQELGVRQLTVFYQK